MPYTHLQRASFVPNGPSGEPGALNLDISHMRARRHLTAPRAMLPTQLATVLGSKRTPSRTLRKTPSLPTTASHGMCSWDAEKNVRETGSRSDRRTVHHESRRPTNVRRRRPDSNRRRTVYSYLSKSDWKRVLLEDANKCIKECIEGDVE